MSTPLRQKPSYSRNAYLKKVANSRSKSPSQSSSSVSLRSRSPMPDPAAARRPPAKKYSKNPLPPGDSRVAYIQLANPFSGKVTRLGAVPPPPVVMMTKEKPGTGHHSRKEPEIGAPSPSFRGEDPSDRLQTGAVAEQQEEIYPAKTSPMEDTENLGEIIRSMRSRGEPCSVEKVMDITSVLAQQLSSMRLTMASMQRSADEKESPERARPSVPAAGRLMRAATETDRRDLVNESYSHKFELQSKEIEEANGELLKLREELDSLRQEKDGEIASNMQKIIELEETVAKMKESNDSLQLELKQTEVCMINFEQIGSVERREIEADLGPLRENLANRGADENGREMSGTGGQVWKAAVDWGKTGCGEARTAVAGAAARIGARDEDGRIPQYP